MKQRLSGASAAARLGSKHGGISENHHQRQ